MKALGRLLLMLFLGLGFVAPVWASNWDVAGKVLTIVEGARIVTGGKVDPVGTVIGLVRGKQDEGRQYYARQNNGSMQRVWVPEYVWKREYVPEHKEYSPNRGEVIVEGHFIRYKEECAGHWVSARERDDQRSYQRR